MRTVDGVLRSQDDEERCRAGFFMMKGARLRGFPLCRILVGWVGKRLRADMVSQTG